WRVADAVALGHYFERDVPDGCGNAGRDRGIEQHPHRRVYAAPAGRRNEGPGSGRAGLPRPAAPGADDLAGDHHRADAHGAETRSRQRILRAARPRHHRRPERVRRADGDPGSGRISLGLRPGGQLMRPAPPTQSRDSKGAVLPPECGARLSACRRLFRRRRVTSSFSLAIALLALAALGGAQDTLRLTLKEAEKTALRNNPQIAASRYTAEAAAQV